MLERLTALFRHHEEPLPPLDENLALESRNARERLERLQEAQRNREHRLRERRAAKVCWCAFRRCDRRGRPREA